MTTPDLQGKFIAKIKELHPDLSGKELEEIRFSKYIVIDDMLLALSMIELDVRQEFYGRFKTEFVKDGTVSYHGDMLEVARKAAGLAPYYKN